MKQWDPKEYDQNYFYVWKAAASLIDLLAPQPGERILDLGCGTGSLTAQLAAKGVNVVGIDASERMVEEARSRFPEIRFEVADARDYRPHDLFDAVFSNAALHWILEPEAVAKTVWEALHPGGRFVAEFGGHGNVRSIQQAITRAAQSVGQRPPRIWYFPTIPEYSALLERQGLEVTLATLFDRPTPLEKGLRGWLEMFASPVVEAVPKDRRENFFAEAEKAAKPALFREGQWIADYRRLRIIAVKGGS